LFVPDFTRRCAFPRLSCKDFPARDDDPIMPARLSDDDIIMIVRLCIEHERQCERSALEARARGDFREAAMQYQRKERYTSLKDKLMRASHVTTETRAILQQLNEESDDRGTS
jgi:hypothetical protein